MGDGDLFEWTDSVDMEGIASLSIEEIDFRKRQLDDDKTSMASSMSMLTRPVFRPGSKYENMDHRDGALDTPQDEFIAFAALHESRKSQDSAGWDKPLSYTERLQRLRGSGGPPSAMDVVRKEVRGSGSALQRSVDLSEVIHASSKNFHQKLPSSLSALLDFDSSRNSSMLSRDASSLMQEVKNEGDPQNAERSTSIDTRGNTRERDDDEVHFGAGRPASREPARPNPWPYGIRPSHFAAEAVSRRDFGSKSPVSRGSKAPLFAESDSAFRRLQTEDVWAQQRRLLLDAKQTSLSYSAPINSSRPLSLTPPAEKDARFRLGDRNLWRCDVARSKDSSSDAVELVGVGAHVHPLFKPTFRPTPRRIIVGA